MRIGLIVEFITGITSLASASICPLPISKDNECTDMSSIPRFTSDNKAYCEFTTTCEGKPGFFQQPYLVRQTYHMQAYPEFKVSIRNRNGYAEFSSFKAVLSSSFAKINGEIVRCIRIAHYKSLYKNQEEFDACQNKLYDTATLINSNVIYAPKCRA